MTIVQLVISRMAQEVTYRHLVQGCRMFYLHSPMYLDTGELYLT
jgi:hypothetical protein